MPKRFIFLFVSILALTAHMARADIYRSVDASGHVTFSNMPSPGAVRILVESPHPHQSKTHQTNVAHSTTEANFPRINPSAQQKMDATRRKILQKELTRQKDALAQAKKAYKAAASIRLGSEHNYQKYLDRVKPYKNAVKIDEQNVHAIEQELYKLRNTGYLAQ